MSEEKEIEAETNIEESKINDFDDITFYGDKIDNNSKILYEANTEKSSLKDFLINSVEKSVSFSYQDNLLKIIGASVIGKMHLKNNTNRDDSISFAIKDEFIVLTLSDGAGSKEVSRLGSSFCVNEFIKLFFQFNLSNIRKRIIETDLEKIDESKYYIEKDIKKILDNLHNNMSKLASQLNISIKDLGCTFLSFIYDKKNNWIILVQIGDGLIVGLDKNDNAIKMITTKESDLGSTFFITMDKFQDYLKVKCYSKEDIENFKSFFIMTDGVSEDISYPPPENILSKWCAAMDNKMRSKDIDNNNLSESLKNWLYNYEAQASFDDRTLASIINIEE